MCGWGRFDFAGLAWVAQTPALQAAFALMLVGLALKPAHAFPVHSISVDRRAAR